MNTVTTVAGYVVAVAVIAAITVLTWHGSINGEAAVGLFATVLGGGGAATISHVSAKSGARAALAHTVDDVDNTTAAV